MKHIITVILLLACTTFSTAQERIDGTFAFQTDPAKKYSLYIPSGYDANEPHRLMLGLHPLNTSRWDAESWCDTLIVFAETNNLILACPDGGVDGAVNDPIDIEFTTALLDSMALWYNINPDKTYAMGFSWGGLTTYTYGLNNIERFRGFIPIGAAVNGTNEVNGIIQNAADIPYYIVHGSQDSPSVRFTPIKNALENNGAIVNSILMNGVGHTIDFPNRNQILTDAFVWVDSVNCAASSTTTFSIEKNENQFSVFPNPSSKTQQVNIQYNVKKANSFTIRVMATNGQELKRMPSIILEHKGSFYVNTTSLVAGQYWLQVYEKNKLIDNIPFQIIK